VEFCLHITEFRIYALGGKNWNTFGYARSVTVSGHYRHKMDHNQQQLNYKCYLSEHMKAEFYFILRSSPLSYVQMETVLNTDSPYGQHDFLECVMCMFRTQFKGPYMYMNR
jgi:hypothetical protein